MDATKEITIQQNNLGQNETLIEALIEISGLTSIIEINKIDEEVEEDLARRRIESPLTYEEGILLQSEY